MSFLKILVSIAALLVPLRGARVSSTSGSPLPLLEEYDETSFVQVTGAIRFRKNTSQTALTAQSDSHPLRRWGSSHGKSGVECSQGVFPRSFQEAWVTTYDFEQGRDCVAFTNEEMNASLMSWPYLTRWCKVFNSGGKDQKIDGCMAQKCLAQENPSEAAKVWWARKSKEGWMAQASEAKYCWTQGLCSSGNELTQKSTVHDMEKYCDKHSPIWRQVTPSDWLWWLATSNLSWSIPTTCSWGTLHCDAVRCQEYLCSSYWNHTVREVGHLIEPF